MRDVIRFKVVYGGEEQDIATCENEYANLMELILDRCYVDEFGDCGGMGKCGTCVVVSSELNGTANQKLRNEPTTLKRHGFNSTEFRLSCQIMVTDEIDNAVFEVALPG